MGPFLAAIFAAMAASYAADAAPGAAEAAGPHEIALAWTLAAALVLYARASGRHRAIRRAARGLPSTRIGGGARLGDLLIFGFLTTGTPFGALVASAVPVPGVADLLVFLPYLAACLARYDAALAFDSRKGRSWSRAREVGFQGRFLTAPVLPVFLIGGIRDALGATPEVQAAALSFPGFESFIGVASLLAVATAAPLLFRFVFAAKPLENGDVRAACDDVLRRASFPLAFVGRVDTDGRVMNAVFLGMFRPFRTVLFTDAILARLGLREIAAVFAHEVGHGARRHLMHFTVYVATLVLGLHVFGDAIGSGAEAVGRAIGSVLGDPQTAMIAAQVAAAVLVLGVFVAALWFLFGFVSRRFETEADLFASDTLGDPEAFARALAEVGLSAGPAALQDGFRHFGVPKRIAIVRACAADPAARRAWDGVFLKIRVGIAVAAVCVLAGLLMRLPEDVAVARLGYPAALVELKRNDATAAEVEAALASLSSSLADPDRASASGARGTALLMSLFDDAMRAGDFARAESLRDRWSSGWPAGDPIGDFNRIHAEAQLASLGDDADLARRTAEADLAAMGRLGAEIAAGRLSVDPTSRVATEAEIRFLAALSGLAPAGFDPLGFASARVLAALERGPGEVAAAEARKAEADLADDAAWRRAALDRAALRRFGAAAAAALRARYADLWENEGR